jgi:hypothetical protein
LQAEILGVVTSLRDCAFFGFCSFKILQNKTDFSFLDLAKSKEKEESVG